MNISRPLKNGHESSGVSRIIPRENLADFHRWDGQLIDKTGHPEAEWQGNPWISDEESNDKLSKQAYEEGFAQGYHDSLVEGKKAGLAEGQVEIQKQTKRLNQLMAALNKPFEVLDQQMAQELVTLGLAIARQVIYREIRTDPDLILKVVQKALEALPSSSRHIHLYLHPDDVELVSNSPGFFVDKQKVEIVESTEMNRGDCKVVTEVSHIDASVEKRINKMVASLFKDTEMTSVMSNEKCHFDRRKKSRISMS